MAFHRLRRIAVSNAFTLPEVVASLVIISLSAALMLSATVIASELVARAVELCEESDSAVIALYRGEADKLIIKPPVRIEYSDGAEYEKVDGNNGVELPWLKVDRVAVGDVVVLYYYSGEYGEETVNNE